MQRSVRIEDVHGKRARVKNSSFEASLSGQRALNWCEADARPDVKSTAHRDFVFPDWPLCVPKPHDQVARAYRQAWNRKEGDQGTRRPGSSITRRIVHTDLALTARAGRSSENLVVRTVGLLSLSAVGTVLLFHPPRLRNPCSESASGTMLSRRCAFGWFVLRCRCNCGSVAYTRGLAGHDSTPPFVTENLICRLMTSITQYAQLAFHR